MNSPHRLAREIGPESRRLTLRPPDREVNAEAEVRGRCYCLSPVKIVIPTGAPQSRSGQERNSEFTYKVRVPHLSAFCAERWEARKQMRNHVRPGAQCSWGRARLQSCRKLADLIQAPQGTKAPSLTAAQNTGAGSCEEVDFLGKDEFVLQTILQLDGLQAIFGA